VFANSGAGNGVLFLRPIRSELLEIGPEVCDVFVVLDPDECHAGTNAVNGSTIPWRLALVTGTRSELSGGVTASSFTFPSSRTIVTSELSAFETILEVKVVGTGIIALDGAIRGERGFAVHQFVLAEDRSGRDFADWNARE